jgi:hypothetical protein
LAAGKIGWDIGNKLNEYEQALDAARNARKRALDYELRMNDILLGKFKSTMSEMDMDVQTMNRVNEKIQTRETLLEAAPEHVSNRAFIVPPMDKMKKLQQDSIRIMEDVQKRGVENLSVEQQREFLRVAGSDVPESKEELLAEVKKLAEIMSEMSKTVKESSRRTSTGIKEPGIGNPYDSADPLSNMLSLGNTEWIGE